MITLPVNNAPIITGSLSAKDSTETQQLSQKDEKSTCPIGLIGSILDQTDAISMELKSREADLKRIKKEIEEASKKQESIEKSEISLRRLGKLTKGSFTAISVMCPLSMIAGIFSAALPPAMFLPVTFLGLLSFPALVLMFQKDRKVEKEILDLIDYSMTNQRKLTSISDEEERIQREYDGLIKIRANALDKFRSLPLNENSSLDAEPEIQDNDGYIIIENIKLNKRKYMAICAQHSSQEDPESSLRWPYRISAGPAGKDFISTVSVRSICHSDHHRSFEA